MTMHTSIRQSHETKTVARRRPLLAALIAALCGTASVTRAEADVAFAGWIDSFWPTARAAGVDRATYDRAFNGVTQDEETIRLMNKQSEFVKPIWDYLGSAVSNARIETGREMLRTYGSELAEIERRYGVNKEVVLAIWGMETNYGNFMGKHYVVQALATLAYAAPRRSEFWRNELVTALLILRDGHVTSDRMEGSWAGAMGHTQFMPSSWKTYSSDYDGDGRHDIWTSVPDALASTANYLNRHGWVKGKTWGYEVRLPTGFDYSLVDEDTEKSLAEWSRLGVRRTGDRAFPRPEDDAVLVLPAGASGPAFLMLKNFFVIKRYNNATSYALAVGHLADRLLGGSDFAQAWPVNNPPLSGDEIVTMQSTLNRRGFDVGQADGKVGPATRSGIRAFQRSVGLVPDGYASQSLLARLTGTR